MCVVAKDTPRAGSRSVEAVVDSGSEESVATPNAFSGEIHASAMSKTGGKYKAANGTRIPNLGRRQLETEQHSRHKVVKSRTSRLDGR